MLDHYAVYFLSDPKLSIWLIDETADYKQNVNHLFASETSSYRESEPFKVNGLDFTAHHFLKPKSTRKNSLSLCAAKRVVQDIELNTLSVDLGEPIFGEDGVRSSYHIAVTGDYLDTIADGERTGFKFLTQGAYSIPEEITRRELLDAIRQLAEAHQQEQLTKVQNEKAKRVNRIVSEHCPHLRPFISEASSRIANLPLHATERQIEAALYEAKADSREKMESLANQIVTQYAAHEQVQAYAEQLVSQFVTDANRHNQSALAEYVCTRKAVLNVLEANLGTGEDGEHEYERVIHDLIFPRGHTSESIPTGSSRDGYRRIDNLWLVDERLVFHQLLASDMPLKQLRGFLSDSDERGDITIFEPAFISNEPDDFQTITLIEFKRPGRKDFGDGEKRNPVQQLIGLAKKIREGEFQDVKGRTHRLPPGAMIYGYVICDITDRLKETLETSLDMRIAADGESYYYYHNNSDMMIEVISYKKLVRNAARRNAGFFKELGLR